MGFPGRPSMTTLAKGELSTVIVPEMVSVEGRTMEKTSLLVSNGSLSASLTRTRQLVAGALGTVQAYIPSLASLAATEIQLPPPSIE